MMHIAGKIRISLRTPLLVDGHTSPSTGQVDATTARDGHRLLVPASTLRGALREACVRLENAEIDGDSPWGGPLCAELFGVAGRDRPGVTDGTDIVSHQGPEQDVDGDAQQVGGRGGRLRVEDARGDSLVLSIRHGVGVDRKTGAARPEIHFQREVGGTRGDVLEADFECLGSEAALDLLRRGVRLVTAIGNSQSRGLGWVDLTLDERAVAPRPTLSLPAAGSSGWLVDITAMEPLMLGGLPSPSNTRVSLDFIPGSTLRGALGAAALRAGLSHEDPRFRAAFVDPETCISFSDALPFDGEQREKHLPLPAPRSRLACKHADAADHNGAPCRDTLIPAALAALVLGQGSGGVAIHRCEVCDRPLTSARGWLSAERRGQRVAPNHRVVTRLARDVSTGSVMPGMLYSAAQLEAKAKFRATLSRVSEDARELLASIDGPVLVGGMRSRGLGKIRISFTPHGGGGVTYRRQQLAKTAKPLCSAAARLGAAAPDAASLIPVLARTDLALDPAEAPARVGDALFGAGRFEVLAVAQAAGVRSGWSDIAGGPRPLRPVVASGSAWLFVVSDEALDDARLAAAELDGIGDERELGLGRITVAPKALMEGWG